MTKYFIKFLHSSTIFKFNQTSFNFSISKTNQWTCRSLYRPVHKCPHPLAPLYRTSPPSNSPNSRDHHEVLGVYSVHCNAIRLVLYSNKKFSIPLTIQLDASFNIDRIADKVVTHNKGTQPLRKQKKMLSKPATQQRYLQKCLKI